MTDETLLKPTLCSPVETHQVRHQRIFRFSVRNSFLPKGDQQLHFELLNTPDWMRIGASNAMISGSAPKVTKDTKFLVTVGVSNAYGKLTHSFFVSVICTDIVDVYAQKLMNQYGLKKHTFYSDHHPYEHSILEYLYVYLQDCEDTCSAKVEMSPFSKIEMSPRLIEITPRKEDKGERGIYNDEYKRNPAIRDNGKAQG